MSSLNEQDRRGLELALDEAKLSYSQGGIPVGAALVAPWMPEELKDAGDEAQGLPFNLLGLGHNERIQKNSATMHAELAALEKAGRLGADVHRRSTLVGLYSELDVDVCSMCAGAILLYKIPKVIIGERHNYKGEEEMLKVRGVEVIILDDPECKELLTQYISEHPEVWNEDIGD
ncbi:hypothetical protein AX16_008536 [Volvariella volvacea WC 439]|nr:hypothetical protein AX16_008536 [Volvariella volvacea WC 439]